MVPGLLLPCCSMPRGRPPTTSKASARQPSQRRAAMLKRAAESASSVPEPQARRRRQVSAAAGRPDEVDHPVVTAGGLQPTAGTSTAEMVAIVTREVLKHLREERVVASLQVAVPAVPVPVLPVEIPVVPVPVVTSQPQPAEPSRAAEQMDGAVAGVINSLLQGDVGEAPLPKTLPLHSTALGADLSDWIKGKIWANEYVDFYDLIHNVQPQQVSVSTGSSHQVISMMTQPGKEKQISTIDQWTSAFLVFGTVYTQRFPHSAPGMFKYCEVVRDIAQTCPMFAWRQHDEQFRNFRHSDPESFPWDQPRWDLFFKCMYVKQVRGGSGRAPATLSHKPARHIQPSPAGYCWGYQRGNKCTATQCKFKHVCAKCQLPHPASLCRKQIPPHTSKP